MADKVSINGGSELLYKVAGASGSAVRVNEVETVGDIAQQRAEVNATPLNSKSIRYIAGLKDGQPVEIAMFYLGDDTSQEALVTAYHAGTPVEFTLQPDPDECETQMRFTLSLTAHTIRAGQGADPRRRMITGRISGEVIEEANART